MAWLYMDFPGGASGKEPTCLCRRYKRLGFNLLEEGTATHSGILVWRIPWTKESGRLQSIMLQRVRSNLAHMHTVTESTS